MGGGGGGGYEWGQGGYSGYLTLGVLTAANNLNFFSPISVTVGIGAGPIGTNGVAGNARGLSIFKKYIFTVHDFDCFFRFPLSMFLLNN